MSSAVLIKVRGYHLDFYGHVNNARYLEFLEEARWSAFEKVIGAMYQKGYSFGIVNININYREPAVLAQELKVDAHISKVGNKSFTISQKVTLVKDDTLIADADVICVVIDNKTGKAIPVESDLLKMMGD